MTEQIIKSFFNSLSISFSDIQVSQSDDVVDISLQTEQSSLLIGMHGKNLPAFQHLLSRMIEHDQKRFIRVHLEVNDYMKSKDEKFFRFLDSKIEFILATGKSSTIKNLNSFERKKAHDYIANKNIEAISTHSEGEGDDRVFIISPSASYIPSIPNSSTVSSKTPIDPLLSEDGV
jgi:spoIIIJ-associated protein